MIWIVFSIGILLAVVGATSSTALVSMAMLVVTFLVSAVTLGTGRTYMMQGAVHLVLFAAFLFLALVP